MPSSRSSFDNHHHRNPTSTTTNFSAPPRHHQPFDSPPPNYNNNNNNQRPTTTGFSGPPGQQQPRHHQPFDSPPPNYNPNNNNNNNNNNNQRPTTGLSGPPPSQQPPRHHQPFDSQRPTTTGFSGPPGQQQPRHHQPFDSPPPNYPVGGGGRGGFRPMGGGGRGFGGDFGMAHAGQKRGHPFSARAGGGSSPDGGDGGSFAKLFVGSVPKTAVEEEIRPLFEEHGEVIEVALLKDKRTGLQQGCCFIKYATSEEADRAIGALHNKYTLPGGVGPIQVRYADGERERLGAVEHKLFVGSLNRQATEKEIEEIFSPYGRVEDVYIMRDEVKQSRGCGFVKFSHREMAAAAIAALSGIYVMRGCEQPLTVRFADPKRPRGAESRGGPAFGGPGSGPRSQAFSGVRPPPYLGDPMGGHPPPNAWHPMSSQNVVQSPQANNTHGFGSHLTTKGGIVPALSAMGGAMGGPTNGSHAGPTFPSSSLPQTSDPSMSQASSIGQQVSPMLKLNQSTQHFLPPYQLHSQQMGVSYSQKDTPPVSIHQMGMLQNSSSTSQSSSSQAMPSQQIFNLSGQLPVSQSHVQQTASSAAAQFVPPNFQRHGMSSTASQQLSAPASQQHLLQPLQQSPTQLAQVLSQQTQALQASFQSSQQAFSQLQQQLHLIQKSTQSPSQQQASQVNKQQSPWPGTIPHTGASTPAAPGMVVPSTSSAAAAPSIQMTAPLTCNWTEHTSPEGYKYYYNSATTESKWEKPEELVLFEQQQQHKQQQQQKPSVQHQIQSQSHPHSQILSSQQVSQAQQVQLQAQMHSQQQFQLQRALSSSDPGYTQSQPVGSLGVDPARFQQGPQATQEWMWKNKPAGS